MKLSVDGISYRTFPGYPSAQFCEIVAKAQLGISGLALLEIHAGNAEITSDIDYLG